MTAVLLLTFFVVVALSVAVAQSGWFDRHRCDCGRSRVPFLYKSHNKVWTMWISLVETVVITVANALNLVGGDHSWLQRLVTGLMLICAVLVAGGIYYHEKDKIKRAARALGRVVIGSNSRLAVVKGD